MNLNLQNATPFHSPLEAYKNGGLPAIDRNPVKAWPGRIDPCDMSEQVEHLLQVLVEQISHGNLTPAQQALAKQDLAMIATRCFCEGRVGANQALKIHVNGGELQLDAVDLTLLLDQLVQHKQLGIKLFEHVAQVHEANIRSPQKIKLQNPDNLFSPVIKKLRGEELKDFLEQPNLISPLYREMNEIIRVAPLKAFDAQQQQLAQQIIELLPVAAQGKLRGVPAELIGVDDFVQVMQQAAHQKNLPTEVQYFRDNCANNDGLKKAIYSNPNIAARILGLSANPLPARVDSQSLARQIATQILDATRKIGTQGSHVSSLVKRFATGTSASRVRLKQAFKALGNYAGFTTQQMAKVPSCFPDIECPESTKVPANLSVHANVVSMGLGRRAIAAMQPVHTKDPAESNLPAFYQLLASEPNTTVFDLRSNSDFEKGSFDYCPAVGETRTVSLATNRPAIKVTTLDQKMLPHGGCEELTLQVKVGNESAKQVKVIQFKNWPDRAVITSDQLRDLGSLMSRELAANQRVITHCRAGVGRTGTLLAYEHLRHDLIERDHGRALVDEKGLVNKDKLLQAITEVVAQGRIERGPYFVQTEAQFTLLYDTLKADLKTNANKLHAGQVKLEQATAPKSSVASLLRKIGLANHPESVFSPEPVNKTQGTQNWQSILDAGENAVEIISDPKRLMSYKTGSNRTESNHGLGVLLSQLISMKGEEAERVLGNHRVLAIKKVESSTHDANGQPVYKQRFEIRYQTAGTRQTKSMYFTQFLTHFDGLKLTASQLNTIEQQLGEGNSLKPKWLTSIRGVGRPSALLVAQAMHSEIKAGRIKNEPELIKTLDTWIAKGRATMGSLFINSEEQREELITLGKNWLNQQKT